MRGETAMIVGAVPFEGWKEKDRVVRDIRREFHNRVKITVAEGFIYYRHYTKVS